MNLFITFVILNIFNVIIQTVKSIATIKCGKGIAALVNAMAYGLYTVVVVYMVCDLPLWVKVAVVAIANLIGVYIVKFVEEKKKKDKLWKVELAVKEKDYFSVHKQLKVSKIPHNYLKVGEYMMFNCYCMTQKDTLKVQHICKAFNGKISAYETKTLIDI